MATMSIRGNSAMTTSYLVSSDRGAWNVSLGGQTVGRHLTRQAAVRTAIDEAHAAGEGEVFLEREDGATIFVWAYGDPYPPKMILG